MIDLPGELRIGEGEASGIRMGDRRAKMRGAGGDAGGTGREKGRLRGWELEGNGRGAMAGGKYVKHYDADGKIPLVMFHVIGAG
jgi:hypothetical protein